MNPKKLLAIFVCLAVLLAATPILAKSAPKPAPPSTPTLTLAPEAGFPGGAVSASGSLFAKLEMVNLYFDGALVGMIKTTKSRTFTVSFTVPAGAALGAHTVSAVSQKSKDSATAAFTVLSVPPGPGPGIVLSPVKGPPTSQVTVGGAHFGPNETVEIRLGTLTVAYGATDGAGVFAEGFQVPREALPGAKTVTATGQTSGLSAEAEFKVQTDWAMFHFDNRRSGYNPFENVLNKDNVIGLVERWRWSAPVGDRPLFGSPAVANGVVYVGTYAHLYAFDSATGVELWKSPVGDVRNTPAVVNGVVYVCSFDTTGDNLYALNAASGVPIWDAPAPYGDLSNSPAVANGVVYVGSGEGTLYALNAATGAKIWDATASEGYILSSPAVANGVVYVASQDFKLYAFDAATGLKPAGWSNPSTGGYNQSAPAVVNGVVYVGSFDGKLYAFDAVSGAKLWDATTGDWVDATPAVVNGVVYVGSFDGKFYAFNAATGAKLWDYETETSFPIGSSPAVANGVVYVGCADHKLYAFDAATGAKLWSATTGGNIYSDPAVSDGMVFVSSFDYNFYAYGLPQP
jgi:outer membrane protein assembly factor BamB